ncbi:metalloregulator ArsR/SmtB family transcription factor [Methylobacterium sp. NEAU 140]|uniref:ArsR/SmtB family transcription factor n=1 Tax=Methylobacterium sp. NEAU 140 TaxID=3064945 RepID=UPI0027337306|nr:metalloregulator ArsR/SmtB family transcription factor [Methylobacterium sp. NEAU 140]MDP4021604.1 metalloregulator ArsR/SmtB family transcription factor [Methylobacterium sp. NEAU 140]
MVDRSDQRLDAIFHALADPTRRAILGMLAQREHAIGELAPAFPISGVAVSKHVRTLEAAGLVTRRVRGRSHLCRLDPVALLEAHRWLGGYQRFWSERLDALEALLEEMKREPDGR